MLTGKERVEYDKARYEERKKQLEEELAGLKPPVRLNASGYPVNADGDEVHKDGSLKLDHEGGKIKRWKHGWEASERQKAAWEGMKERGEV
ncbi:MAG: hypothetical protein ACREIQ_01835 [Nitrospiria bacterium]